MKISELQDAQQEMECSIKHAVSGAMSKFYDETGLSPRNITIELMEVSVIGADGQQFIVSDVRSDVVL